MLLTLSLSGGSIIYPHARPHPQRIWRWLVVPALALAVVGEYTVLLGPPPIPDLPAPGWDINNDLQVGGLPLWAANSC